MQVFLNLSLTMVWVWHSQHQRSQASQLLISFSDIFPLTFSISSVVAKRLMPVSLLQLQTFPFERQISRFYLFFLAGLFLRLGIYHFESSESNTLRSCFPQHLCQNLLLFAEASHNSDISFVSHQFTLLLILFSNSIIITSSGNPTSLRQPNLLQTRHACSIHGLVKILVW